MAFAIFKTHCQKCGKQLGLFDGIVCSECFTNKSKLGYFRYPTKEEADSVNRYINSISSQTSVNFWDNVT